METFFATLNTTLLLFTFILIGYFMKKKRLLPEATDAVLSKLENIVLVPAVVISTFITRCTIENIQTKWTFILFAILVLAIVIPFSFIVGKMLGRDDLENRIFRYSAAIPNFSFFGIPLVRGAFGEEALFNYLIFCLPMYLVCYSIGVVWLIPTKEGSKVTIKSFCNPICISLVIGIVLGLLQVKLPGFLDTALSNAAACMGPLAMLLTGFVVAGYEIRDLLGDRRIYVMAALRLMIIPFVVCTIFKLFSVDSSIVSIALCYLAMPLGLNTIVIPAAYGGDTMIGASCALIASVFAVITIPIMFLVI